MSENLTRLKVLRGLAKQTDILLDKTSVRLGRDPSQNDIVLPAGDKRISRQHMELAQEFGRWVLVDHSRNGVYVNGELVRQSRRELQHGDRIAIGDSVELAFDDPNSTFAAEEAGRRLGEPASHLKEGIRPGMHIDLEAMLVYRGDLVLDVEWSPQEFALLRCLYQKRGQVCGHVEIITAVWGDAGLSYGREHVHELVARVRRKLEIDPAKPIYLLTRPGCGYVFVI